MLWLSNYSTPCRLSYWQCPYINRKKKTHGATSSETLIYIVPFASNWFGWFEKKYITHQIYQPFYRFVYRWLSCLQCLFVCLYIVSAILFCLLFFVLFSYLFLLCFRANMPLHADIDGAGLLCFHQHMSSTCTTSIFISYFWFLMVVTVNIIAFWNLIPRSVVNVFQNFGGLCYFHPKCRGFSISHPLSLTPLYAGGPLCVKSWRNKEHTEHVGEAATFWTCIRYVLGSNPRSGTGYRDRRFLWPSQFLQANYKVVLRLGAGHGSRAF